MTRRIVLTGFILLTVVPLAFAQTDWLKKSLDGLKTQGVQSVTTTKLSDTKISSGLKEALRVGLDNAVKLTSQAGGFFDNQAIKILIPEKIRAIEPVLKSIGLNKQLDEFVLSMNRAAESATPVAKDIFLNALMNMSIEDTQKVFTGGDTAATDYFKSKTKDKLVAAFQPMVQKTLDSYGISKQYNALVGKYKTIPFAKNLPSLDADQYVVNKTVDGLFYVLGQEEAKIRKDPAARVTDLLKEVFK
jgi:hypothetical protein